jgi:raffinose/stachyose/melibiose transport system permease protein
MKHQATRTMKVIASTAVLAVLSLFVLVPSWIILINSLKNPGEAGTLGLGLPSKWLLVNYYHVFIEGRLLRGFLNSALITLSSVFAILFTGSLAGYVISRRRNPLTTSLYLVFIIGLVAPPQIVPSIKLLQILGIHGTYLGIILFYSGIFLPFAVLLISGFIKSVPREIDESAMIDGCRPFHIFIRIVFPLLKPVFATSFVLIFMYVWNDFKYPLYLLRTSRMWTLQMSVFNFTSAYGNLWNYVFADLIMASLPVIIVYFLAQNFIISGLTAGALKG